MDEREGTWVAGAGDDGRGNAPSAHTHTHYLTAVFKKCSVQSGQDVDATTIVHFNGLRKTPDQASIRVSSLLSHSYAIWVRRLGLRKIRRRARAQEREGERGPSVKAGKGHERKEGRAASESVNGEDGKWFGLRLTSLANSHGGSAARRRRLLHFARTISHLFWDGRGRK